VRIGPILLERIRLSDNLSPDFAPVLEARLVAALSRATEVAIVRCAECWATRGRLDRGAWVVSRGVNGREEMTTVAGKYAAKTFMTVALTWQERPSSLAMDVELVRADDSSIAFAEQYRMTPDTTLLYRGADRAQLRAEKLKELQDRLESRPRFGYAVEAGTMLMQSTSGSFWGVVGRYQLTERFGNDGPFEAGLSLGGFVNTGTFALALIGATLSARVSPDQLLASEWRVVGNAGTLLMAGANSFYGGAGIRFKPAVRFTLHVNVNYIAPFQIRGTGPEFGNVCPEVGLGFSWP
jgi:hypothetical protein